MSERKTAEVKFRCTPTFKASLAADADAAGQSMSEYLESSVSLRRSARVADEVVGGAIEAEHAARIVKAGLGQFVNIPGPDATLKSMAFGPSGSFREVEYISTNVGASGAVECCAGHPVNAGSACDDCPPLPEDGAADGTEQSGRRYRGVKKQCAGGCKPWEFCACKADA